jgi:hypothetical protein
MFPPKRIRSKRPAGSLCPPAIIPAGAKNFNNIASVEAEHPQDVNLGTVLEHELIGHGVKGLPDEQPFWEFWRPVAVDLENQIRRELGMYQRDGWEPSHCDSGGCTILLYKNLNNGIIDYHSIIITWGKPPDH